MKTRFFPTALAILAVTCGVVPAAEPPPLEACEKALEKAVAFFHGKVAIHGGYSFQRPLDLSYAEAEHGKGLNLISIQPPGTTTVGLVFLEAWRATGNEAYLKASRDTAEALIQCQLASGGWPAEFDFEPEEAKKYHLQADVKKGDVETGKRRNHSTLDDNKTESALQFLLELAHEPSMKDDEALQNTVQVGMDALLGAQAPNGAWPQQFDRPADPSLPVKEASFPETWSRKFPKVDYRGFYTLNDGNHLHCIEVLILAHELTGHQRYLEAANKAGEFLLMARLPQPQPVWAQQYDFDMHPVWARKFEPPAASSAESAGAMEALVKLWGATGETKYVEVYPEVLAWFKKTQLPDGRWARFYELETNRPLYCQAETYKVTYDDSDLPTHYGFKIDESMGRKLDRWGTVIAAGIEKFRRDKAGPTRPESWAWEARSVASAAKKAIETLDDEGRWVRDGMIDTTDFIRNARALAQCIEALKKSGAESGDR